MRGHAVERGAVVEALAMGGHAVERGTVVGALR